MTVSNAFSRPDQLSDALRERILETAATLGYAGPDPAARALARGTTGAVGVLLTSSLHHAFDDEVATGFLAAVAAELGPTGLAITLLTTSAAVDGVIPARDVALDGALVYSCNPDNGAVDWLRRRGLPLAYVDQQPVADVSCVNVDDRGGARAAAAHLVALGHRRVAVLTLATDPDADADVQCSAHVTGERDAGWLAALEAGGATAVVHRQQRSDDEEARVAALGLLAADDPPTAVLCFSDVMASGVVGAAEELGLEVPGDVSVIGFDDSPLARRLRPQLTTVHQDVPEKGRLAAAALRSAMAHHLAGTDDRPSHVVLPTSLVVRDSTAPPRG
jgi:DNA-binding LacI/PurR family transcriptional regulator